MKSAKYQTIILAMEIRTNFLRILKLYANHIFENTTNGTIKSSMENNQNLCQQ